MRNIYFFETREEAKAKAKELKKKGSRVIMSKESTPYKSDDGRLFIYLTNRETKVSYSFDYCEDIHTERWKNDIDIVFTSRGNRIVCSLIEYDFRIEKE